jgi:hypothetical protein
MFTQAVQTPRVVIDERQEVCVWRLDYPTQHQLRHSFRVQTYTKADSSDRPTRVDGDSCVPVLLQPDVIKQASLDWDLSRY